jgi:hypothetical protein
MFYVERFVKVDAGIRGFGLSQNGKLVRAEGLGEIWRGYFCVRREATKVDLTVSLIALWAVQGRYTQERTGLAVLVLGWACG